MRSVAIITVRTCFNFQQKVAAAAALLDSLTCHYFHIPNQESRFSRWYSAKKATSDVVKDCQTCFAIDLPISGTVFLKEGRISLYYDIFLR